MLEIWISLITRAKQHLYISGSEPKGKDHGWYGKIRNAFESKISENEGPVVLAEYGKNDDVVNDVKESINPTVTLKPELSLPINLKNTQIDISPSQQVLPSANKNAAHEENTLRGIVMHQMLNYISRSDNNDFSKFYSADMINIEKLKLEIWWQKCINTTPIHLHFLIYWQARGTLFSLLCNTLLLPLSS